MNNTNHKTMLSEHFALEEFTYSRIAVENALDNTPSAETKNALQHLATYLLEPLRTLYNAPIAILSGYRSDAVNRLAGGVAASQHCKGEAADCYIPEGPEKLLDILKRSGLVFDQAILYKRRRFLHLSLKAIGRNRMQVLFCMICIVCMFSGCSVRRKTTQHSDTFCYDSVQLVHTDNLFQLSRSLLSDSMVWDLRRIVYTPPDSTGKQYLRHISTARIKQGKTQADTTLTISASNASYQQQTTEVVREKEVEERGNGWVGPFVLCVLFCFLLYRIH